jgi:hypothetical protein
MRCVACNKALSDFESTRKSAATGDYLDLCNHCFGGLGIGSVDRHDLSNSEEMEDLHDLSD